MHVRLQCVFGGRFPGTDGARGPKRFSYDFGVFGEWGLRFFFRWGGEGWGRIGGRGGWWVGVEG